jgi:hypothetical protein
MPFEPAPKPLTIADQLAALIEAGRAANPDLKHGKKELLDGDRACALGFAMLAHGFSRAQLVADSPYEEFRSALGACGSFISVWIENDEGATLDAICAGLRSGRITAL